MRDKLYPFSSPVCPQDVYSGIIWTCIEWHVYSVPSHWSYSSGICGIVLADKKNSLWWSILLGIFYSCICMSLQGDKNLIKFDGDHNSARPQFYYDSVSIFFYNVLNPPQFPSACSNKLEKYYNRGAGTNEVILLFTPIKSCIRPSTFCYGNPETLPRKLPVNSLDLFRAYCMRS